MMMPPIDRVRAVADEVLQSMTASGHDLNAFYAAHPDMPRGEASEQWLHCVCSLIRLKLLTERQHAN